MCKAPEHPSYHIEKWEPNGYYGNEEKFIDEGKEVYLFSFCEHEGDLRTIDRILDLMDDYYQARVNIIDYSGKSGDLYYFVKLYSRMERTICTRFHSLVMSLVFKQELMVVSYSDKLNNLLDDLGYDFDVVNIDQKIGKLVINDGDFKVIDKKILNKFTPTFYSIINIFAFI